MPDDDANWSCVADHQFIERLQPPACASHRPTQVLSVERSSVMPWRLSVSGALKPFFKAPGSTSSVRNHRLRGRWLPNTSKRYRSTGGSSRLPAEKKCSGA